MVKQLRKWQSQAVQELVCSFETGKKHFFCLAATATGKTVMAAESSKQLINKQAIDIVLCFCPTTEIQHGIRKTFEFHLQQPFDGSIQSVGSVHTYQGMLYQSEKFLSLFDNYRVMVVFDEVHHSGGTPYSKSNSWGTQILNVIASKARFILCLSGTPWRSDSLPITTAIYDEKNQIQCDFIYGLASAVRDRVCRKPGIVLIDNSNISVEVPKVGTKVFDSISHALRESPLGYIRIIRDLNAQQFILKKAINKLSAIRKSNPNAGGVVVCSSVDHAEQVLELLRHTFHQKAIAVSYLHHNAPKIIDEFRNSSTPWIVSVGMVSEGTDIPRLQVCCHLSHVRTEMHFRQTLGRILRMNDSKNQESWLYTFAEPNLSEYAHRLQIDIPEMEVNFESIHENDDEEDFNNLPNAFLKSSEAFEKDLSFALSEEQLDLEEYSSFGEKSQSDEKLQRVIYDFELNEKKYIEKLAGLYENNPS